MNLLRRVIRKIDHLLAVKDKNAAPPDYRLDGFINIIDNGYGNKLSSEEKKPVNASGEPIPWFTYPSIEYLSQLDLSQTSVLEWGIGNSTLFFAKRCKRILSIEHNAEWYKLITGKMPENSESHLVPEDMYADFPLQKGEKFDIIIVDGIKRGDCLKTALGLLNEGAMLIFDNADRNPELCQLARAQDLIQVDFHGFGPIVNFTTTTTIFYKRNFNLQPLTVQPAIPIGGGF